MKGLSQTAKYFTKGFLEEIDRIANTAVISDYKAKEYGEKTALFLSVALTIIPIVIPLAIVIILLLHC